MEKILLCGNGININFNEKFKLDIFIEIFKNKEKLKDEIDEITSINSYQKWKDF